MITGPSDWLNKLAALPAPSGPGAGQKQAIYVLYFPKLNLYIISAVPRLVNVTLPT